MEDVDKLLSYLFTSHRAAEEVRQHTDYNNASFVLVSRCKGFMKLCLTRKTLEEAEKALEQYFALKRNVVAERYKFHSRKQNSDEPIDAYLSSLRELAKAREFGEFEDEMIRDQIVKKCHSTNLKERLLAQDSLDLAKTIRIARSNEHAVQETRMLTGLGTKDDPINIDRIKKRSRKGMRNPPCVIDAVVRFMLNIMTVPQQTLSATIVKK